MNRIKALIDAEGVESEQIPAFIIAEAGINHNGDIETAKKLVKAAKETGADAIKFQSYHTEEFVGVNSKNYQLFKDLELSEDEFAELHELSLKEGIEFISTPLDLSYVDVLDRMNVPAFKIASGDLTFIPLLQRVAGTGKPIILSTGMSTIGEIDRAVRTIREAGNDNIILLHCISAYPTPYNEVNLRAIKLLRDVFSLPSGYSDHTIGIQIPIAAVALGAKVIEKHFTLDKDMEGPDHKLSADPKEFTEMVDGIRIIEAARGDGYKRPMPCEEAGRFSGRRGIVSTVDLKDGDIISKRLLNYKRPATGIEPAYAGIIENRRVRRKISKDAPITWDDMLEG